MSFFSGFFTLRLHEPGVHFFKILVAHRPLKIILVVLQVPEIIILFKKIMHKKGIVFRNSPDVL